MKDKQKRGSVTVEVTPGNYEVIEESLLDKCDGDKDAAGFFHSLGSAIQGKDVDNHFLKAGKSI